MSELLSKGDYDRNFLFAVHNSKPNFKQRLRIAHGLPNGTSNVQTGGVFGLEKADTLRSPNKQWLCTLDPYAWSLFQFGHRPVFTKELSHPARVILEEDGLLHIVDTSGHTIWSRGPFGASPSYELRCEDQGDIVLYNGAGVELWSAVKDGV